MASSLAPVAEISNGLIIIVILGCFVAMVIFILLKREGLYETSVKYVQNTSARPMICVHNPFVLSLQDASSALLSDVPLNITIQVQCILQAFWGVSVENLSWLSTLSWNSLKVLLSDEPPEGFSLSKSTVLNLDISWNSVIHLSPLEEISGNDLGEVPRVKYPVVLVLVRTTELSEAEDIDTVVATIIVIHIKDSFCKMESRILAQYLKQASGQTCSLKQLYMSSDLGATSQGSYDSSSRSFEEIDSSCVVCQALPVTRALLPCRHTCICYRCFPRLERCPICRSVIQSYFCIQDENYCDVLEETATLASIPWQQRWEQLNEQLNEWLGLMDRV